jgi:hypothetical protein
MISVNTYLALPVGFSKPRLASLALYKLKITGRLCDTPGRLDKSTMWDVRFD